jgi:hypothetical protein
MPFAPQGPASKLATLSAPAIIFFVCVAYTSFVETDVGVTLCPLVLRVNYEEALWHEAGEV